MARYRGTIKGQRGEASRLGSPKSGLVAYLNGWDIGLYVRLGPCGPDGEDIITVELNGGSNGSAGIKPIGTFTRKDLES